MSLLWWSVRTRGAASTEREPSNNPTAAMRASVEMLDVDGLPIPEEGILLTLARGI